VRKIDIDIPSVSPSHPAGAQPQSYRVRKSCVVLMLVIVGSMALLAVYANIQRSRRDQVETVNVTPATSSPARPH
jgi:hypothetical protein